MFLKYFLDKDIMKERLWVFPTYNYHGNLVELQLASDVPNVTPTLPTRTATVPTCTARPTYTRTPTSTFTQTPTQDTNLHSYAWAKPDQNLQNPDQNLDTHQN